MGNLMSNVKCQSLRRATARIGRPLPSFDIFKGLFQTHAERTSLRRGGRGTVTSLRREKSLGAARRQPPHVLTNAMPHVSAMLATPMLNSRWSVLDDLEMR